VSVCVYAYVR